MATKVHTLKITIDRPPGAGPGDVSGIGGGPIEKTFHYWKDMRVQ